MNTTSIVRNIPLDRLVLSPTNVRKTPPWRPRMPS